MNRSRRSPTSDSGASTDSIVVASVKGSPDRRGTRTIEPPVTAKLAVSSSPWSSHEVSRRRTHSTLPLERTGGCSGPNVKLMPPPGGGRR